MAQDLDYGEFWLPSEFLTDDDLLTDFKKKGVDDFSCGLAKSFGFHSDLSSPVESVTGSTETESDEDDFISFLTRKMNYSTLHDSDKGWRISGSPQSTLCGCKPLSSPVSPKSVSQVSSPPRLGGAVSWDLFYEAAEKVARLQVNEAVAAGYHPKLTYPPMKPSPVTGHRSNRFQASGLYAYPETQAQLSYQKMQAIELKNEVCGHGQRGNQFQNASRIGGVEETKGLSAAAWPTLLQSQRQSQQMPSSGMRAVFLAENGAKKERTGTGVFLPRGYGNNSTETSRKAAGSTVLLPGRVVHALNLNIGSIDASAQAKFRGVQFNADAGFKRKHNTKMAQQGRNLIPQPVVNEEFCLPQDWTY